MIDKALIIIIAFVASGIALVGAEYTLAQVYHVEMVSPLNGQPLNSAIVAYMQLDSFNAATENIIEGNFTSNSTFYDKVETSTTAAAFIAWELGTLMTGTYIFYVMALFGIPEWFIVGLIMIYVLLVARAFIGYVRGV